MTYLNTSGVILTIIMAPLFNFFLISFILGKEESSAKLNLDIQETTSERKMRFQEVNYYYFMHILTL